MGEIHLPPPWNAPQQERACARCNRVTAHYSRRVSTSADDASDRVTGQVFWFCTSCGDRYARAVDAPAPSAAEPDDLEELFDRH
jgi:hypothetical protein